MPFIHQTLTGKQTLNGSGIDSIVCIINYEIREQVGVGLPINTITQMQFDGD